MPTNTKTLFAAILKRVAADCVCDIGSRDGDQSLLFRHLLPNARVIAFEANPINYERMQADPRLKDARIDLCPYAITDARGTARFHITDVDYNDPSENRGTSSLLVHQDLKIKRTVSVPTWRIDEYLSAHAGESTRIALWIDVEGVEYGVLKGMEGIRDKVVAIHVETAKVPLREGQHTYEQVRALLESWQYRACGTNMTGQSTWGDVVFIQQKAATELGVKLLFCRLKAWAGVWLKVDHLAVWLRQRAPGLYRVLRRLYIKVGT